MAPNETQLLVARNHVNSHFRAFMGHVLAEAGRIDEALAILGKSNPDGSWDYASTWGDCLRVDVLANAGPSPELHRMLDRISPWGAEFAIGGSTDFIGSIEYFIGRGREGLGDSDGARAAYQRAVRRNAEARVVPWEARAAQRLAALTSAR